jgi:hypothetical protein
MNFEDCGGREFGSCVERLDWRSTILESTLSETISYSSGECYSDQSDTEKKMIIVIK